MNGVTAAAAGRARRAPDDPDGVSAHLLDPAAGKMLGETTLVVEDGRIKLLAFAPSPLPAGSSASMQDVIKRRPQRGGEGEGERRVI
ncbi:MAG: hypothetical protein EPN69_08900 [Rhodanobacter sp.]|nr:MAG: hypothetical protein EPN69_08900 [Rhodanobacter sp.]TAL99436.1 MAG: hypothetical protein EPN71_07615 [Rhodanobacter sp.]TAM39681.1 MAG: hypothetical protein EPN58_13015 [Rhodanobacter sp.]TAN25255.1 MAG: hypothetical protein EPN32_10365 [Rhodanobacter sp.]